MTTIFGQSLKPPTTRSPFVMDGAGRPAPLTIEGLSFFQQLWSWVAVGYVVIPCDIGGSANAIELTPRFRPEIGASGYVDLLTFSFTAADTSTGATTIQVIGDSALDALPAYVDATPVGAGDFVAGVPYLAIFCEADVSLGLPDRMVRK